MNAMYFKELNEKNLIDIFFTGKKKHECITFFQGKTKQILQRAITIEAFSFRGKTKETFSFREQTKTDDTIAYFKFKGFKILYYYIRTVPKNYHK